MTDTTNYQCPECDSVNVGYVGGILSCPCGASTFTPDEWIVKKDKSHD